VTRVKRLTAHTFRSLRIRNYRLFFVGQMVSMSGTWMQSVAQGWLVLELTGSAVALGTVTALQMLPVLVFGAWAGVLADRFDKRRTLLMTQSAMAAAAVGLALVVASGVVELWMVYALAAASGLATALDNPTRQSFVSEMVGPGEVANAVGLNSAMFNAARIVGPGIGGILIVAVGIWPCFAVNALSYLGLIAALLRMDVDALHRSERVARAKGQVREGLRYVWASPVLRPTLLLVAVVGTFALNFSVLLPLMARFAFDRGAETLGLLTSAMGAGALLGALLTAGRGRPSARLLVGTCLAFGVLLLGAAAAPTLAWELAVLPLAGAAGIAFMSTANSTLQLTASDAMRGRVMALYALVFLGSTPVGGPIVGAVAEHWGPRAGFVLGGSATLAAGLVALAAIHIRGRSGGDDLPATGITEPAAA
jgi:MFS family permease